ncbi:MAG: nicotinamide mononucleotide transporter [Lachnospiraceae bacterium]|nr:nicotinamide mononucleotide transporter [Lachnospiraceae bacterium]
MPTSFTNYFSKKELLLWCSSVILIVISFCLFDKENYSTLLASLVGVTSLIFCAKGNPFGQFLMVIFSLIYGVISYTFAYYGEMITYLGMTLPMSVFALISWLKNPYNGNRSQVQINHIKRGEYFFALILTAIVTVIFYFILKALHTANLAPSTFSVTTSFLAVYLSFRRSPYFALAYAANDIVLIVLWILASMTDIRYFSVVVCFLAFLVNDLYGFYNWKKMHRKQMKTAVS